MSSTNINNVQNKSSNPIPIEQPKRGYMKKKDGSKKGYYEDSEGNRSFYTVNNSRGRNRALKRAKKQ